MMLAIKLRLVLANVCFFFFFLLPDKSDCWGHRKRKDLNKGRID